MAWVLLHITGSIYKKGWVVHDTDFVLLSWQGKECLMLDATEFDICVSG